MIKFAYHYHNCSLIRVEDAGTCYILVSLGFNCQRIVKFQHQEYDAPSYSNPSCLFEKYIAKKAMNFIMRELKDKQFDIISYKTEDECLYAVAINYEKNNLRVRLEQQLAMNELSKSDVSCSRCEQHGECQLTNKDKACCEKL